MVLKEKPIIIIIQETKCSVFTEVYKESIWDGAHEWVIVEAQGLALGLALSWDSRILTFVEEKANHNWIWVIWTLNNANNNASHYVNGINVYAPQNSAAKLRLWAELYNILAINNQEPFCIAGDFNCIRNDYETKNCVYMKKDSERSEKRCKDGM